MVDALMFTASLASEVRNAAGWLDLTSCVQPSNIVRMRIWLIVAQEKVSLADARGDAMANENATLLARGRDLEVCCPSVCRVAVHPKSGNDVRPEGLDGVGHAYSNRFIWRSDVSCKLRADSVYACFTCTGGGSHGQGAQRRCGCGTAGADPAPTGVPH